MSKLFGEKYNPSQIRDYCGKWDKENKRVQCTLCISAHLPDSEDWTYVSCPGGPGSFFDHVVATHSDRTQEICDKIALKLESAKAGQGNKIDPIYLDLKASHEALGMYWWMQMITEENQSFNIVDKDLYKKVAEWQTCSKTMMKLFHKIGVRLMEKIILMLRGKKLGVSLDCWTHEGIHMMAVFAHYTEENAAKKVLLGISPLVDSEDSAPLNANFEVMLGRESQAAFITKVLDMYELKLSDIQYLSGDNCASNIAIKTLGVPLVCCKSHQLRLAANYVLESIKTVVTKIEDLMKGLSELKNSPVLDQIQFEADEGQLINPYFKDHDFRWTGSMTMIERYYKLKKYLAIGIEKELFTRSVSNNVLSRQEEILLKEYKLVLDHFKETTMILQSESCTLKDAYDVFQLLIENHKRKFPDLEKYLGEDAAMIHNKPFESGIRKLQTNSIKSLNSLTPEEKLAVAHFKNPPQVIFIENMAAEDWQQDMSLMEQLAKRRRIDLNVTQDSSVYRPTQHVKPTSNECERLFSQAELILTDRRHRMLPCNLEIVLYLKLNKDLWNEIDVTWVLHRNVDLLSAVTQNVQRAEDIERQVEERLNRQTA